MLTLQASIHLKPYSNENHEKLILSTKEAEIIEFALESLMDLGHGRSKLKTKTKIPSKVSFEKRLNV